MKAIIRKAAEVLQDLLKINNDRVEGYQKAAEDTYELDLKTVFKSMADESKKNASELSREIKKTGDDAGNTFPAGIDEKASGVKDRHARRDSFEYGKEAQSAYRDAISSCELTTQARQLVRNQEVGLKASLSIIRNFREGRHISHTKLL
jgi:hypothetical protein